MGGVSPHISSLHTDGERGGQETDLLLQLQGNVEALHFILFFLSLLRCFVAISLMPSFFVFSLPHFDHVLAEVVVCAVGWVVTLPAMEMTAQATALLVLVPPLQPRIKAAPPPPALNGVLRF